MSILNWPHEDRPREKLLAHSEQLLTDAELIAIFFQTGIRGKTALDLARDLLQQYGGLKKLMSAPKHLLLQQPGIGIAKYAALKAAIELGRRSTHLSIAPGQSLGNSQLTRAFMQERLQHHTKEVFACAFLDTHFHLISFEALFVGTVNQANVYPREMVKRTLELNAAKVILAHNHPSGDPNPSQADKEVTQTLVQALALIEVEVVDHLVVGREVYSFAEQGDL